MPRLDRAPDRKVLSKVSSKYDDASVTKQAPARSPTRVFISPPHARGCLRATEPTPVSSSRWRIGERLLGGGTVDPARAPTDRHDPTERECVFDGRVVRMFGRSDGSCRGGVCVIHTSAGDLKSLARKEKRARQPLTSRPSSPFSPSRRFSSTPSDRTHPAERLDVAH